MLSVTLVIVIAIVVAAVTLVVAVLYCRRHSGKCQARIDGILSEKALEISEPMTMVIGPLSMLIKNETPGTSKARMLQIALANAERISKIMGLELGSKETFASKESRSSTVGSSSHSSSNSSSQTASNSTSNSTKTGESVQSDEDTQKTQVDGSDAQRDITDAMGEALYDATSFLERAQGVVNDHIDDSGFDKDTFAIEMYVSPSTLYKRIKQLSGLSPTDYIKEIRLTKALSLIEETDLPISAISDMCGFSTVAYFGYSFRKRFGITPSEKRKTGKD